MRKLLFAFVLAMLLVPAFAFAVTPNPGHAAYTVGPGMNGSFYNGNYTFPNNLNVTKNLTVLSNLCLGGVCYASWPAGSSMWTNSSGNATFTAGNVGIGTTTPTEKLTLDNGSILITAPGTGRARGTLANLNPGSSYLNEVYVSGRYAYIADSWYNMSIVDVSDPDYPRRISMFDVTGARSVLSIGTTLYVGTGAGLNVLDIQNPAAPVSRATLNIGFDAASIVAAGRYLYVVGDNNTNTSLGIVDVVNQTNPVLAGSITLANWEQIEFANVEVQGDVAYVTNGYQFYLINITTPSAPTILANYSTGYVSDIVVIGSYAYAGGWGQGFKTFDISNTSRITLLDTDASPQITQLVVAGRYAYGITSTGGNNRTVIYDVSNASDIIEIGSINLSAAPNIIEIQGKYLYIGTANALEIIEIPGIDAPTAQLGTLETEQALVNGRLIVDGEAMFSSGVAVGSRGISSIGSISAGNGLSVAGTTNLSGITHTPQLCLNGDCRTAWPTSSANVTSTANGSANYYARFTTTGNIQTGLLSDNGTALVLGATLISTGGNGRGLYATDLQIDRASVTQVASGDYGTLSGGNQNTVAGAYGTVSGGTANNLGTNSAQGTIGGGQ